MIIAGLVEFPATPLLSDVDWRPPWLAPLHATAQTCVASGNWRLACNAMAASRGLRNHRGHPIEFVPQAQLPSGTAYETHISRTGCIPTRANLHDFFNAQIWLTYPQAKAELNAIQAGEIEKHAQSMPDVTRAIKGATRGATRDRATIFDENAAVLLACGSSADAIVRALREHRWQDALLNNRAAFGKACEVRLFGHALIEKLVSPYKAITAHVWVLPVAETYFSMDAAAQCRTLDTALGECLRRGLLLRPSTPLPVLGVPGWAASQDAAFYADRAVFRPRLPR